VYTATITSTTTAGKAVITAAAGLVKSTATLTQAPIGRPPSALTAAQIRAILRREPVPKGRLATIAQIRRRHGFSLKLTVPAAGRLVVDWYLPAPRTRGKHAKPVLIAAGHVTTVASGIHVTDIKVMSAGRHQLAKLQRLTVSCIFSFTPTGGAPVSVTKKFVLRP
jgi:hypothetical protein